MGNKKRDLDGAYSSASAHATETKTQWPKYSHQTGHGFAAEDANAIHDQLQGKHVERVGAANTKDGPDRIVDGAPIQTKYYQTASKSVNSAFDSNGNYRYEGQQLEVPKDQYPEAIDLMKQKIEQGKVPGVNDPEKASSLVKEGNVTYTQARNIAKAGTIDSIKFDIQTQAVTAGVSCGLSITICFAQSVWNGEPIGAALESAVLAGIRTGAVVLTAGVATQQLLRTGLGRSFAAGTSQLSSQLVGNIYKTSIGKDLIEKTASALYGKSLYGAAAMSAGAKLLRTNVVTGTVTTLVITVPDISRIIDGRISPEQFTKNLVVNAASVGGGAGGAALGATLGSAILPGIGTVVGGIAGGIAGSLGLGRVTKAIADEFCEDDAVKLWNILRKELLPKLAEEYLTTESEFSEKILPKIEVVDANWLQDMYAFGNHEQFVRNNFEPLFAEVLASRPKIVLTEDDFQAEIKKIEDDRQAEIKKIVKRYKRYIRRYRFVKRAIFSAACLGFVGLLVSIARLLLSSIKPDILGKLGILGSTKLGILGVVCSLPYLFFAWDWHSKLRNYIDPELVSKRIRNNMLWVLLPIGVVFIGEKWNTLSTIAIWAWNNATASSWARISLTNSLSVPVNWLTIIVGVVGILLLKPLFWLLGTIIKLLVAITKIIFSIMGKITGWLLIILAVIVGIASILAIFGGGGVFGVIGIFISLGIGGLGNWIREKLDDF